MNANSGEMSESAAARAPSGEPQRRSTGRAVLILRLLSLLAAAALVVSPRFPYWNMKLAAPQYPKGLTLTIYPDHVGGDVREIDGLNHYIGMRKIDDAATLERRLGVPAIITLAVCLTLAGFWRSRWSLLILLPVVLFPPLFLTDMYYWLRDSGLNLDPHAALSSSIKPFVPNVLGSGKIAQFRTTAVLGPGYYMSLFAAGVSLCLCYVRLHGVRRRFPDVERTDRTTKVGVASVLLIFLISPPLEAKTWIVEPGGTLGSIGQALDHAASGDTVIVRGGVHDGPLLVRKSIRLVGEKHPVIDGRGHGTVVRLSAPDSELSGFTIRSSGDLLAKEDAGVLVTAPGSRIEHNTLTDVLFGIYLRQASGCLIRGNQLHGKNLPVPRRGDLIRSWYSKNVTIKSNTTDGGRDVVLWYSSDLTIRDNRVTGGRYGLHFMYSDNAQVAGNQLRDNSVGVFLMYSRRLNLHENWIAANRGPSGYGVGLKDMENTRINHNVLVGNKVGLFLEHSDGEYLGNLVADNDKGIVIFPSASGNRFERNSFLRNGEQVEIEGFAGTMTNNVWRSNHWSDYRGYDRDGDGWGDLAYRPERLFERLADRRPALRLFAVSPSAQAIDLASRVFPIFEPRPKFVDDHPRMQPFPPPVVLAGVGDPTSWLLLGALFLIWPLALVVGRSVGLNRASSGSGVGMPSCSTDTEPSTKPAPLPTVDSRSTSPTVESLPAISVQGLTKRFTRLPAVDDLSFEIRQGETVALWGPNGAGKTTVLRCILGLLPCKGNLRVFGQPCGPRGRASRKLIGYVPQEVWLHADQTVSETVRFYARLRRVKAERADQLLADWGLKDVGRRAVRQLSGGMKQKLALVVALLADPPILLLDEPTSNLDARTRGEFSDLLERLKATGKTLLFCTHLPSEVWKLADRVIVLKQGRKVVDGPPDQVREQFLEPAHLCLTVAADQAAIAVSRLKEGGFNVRQTGSRIWVVTPAGRKMEAIELLGQSGVRVLDFDLESDRASSSTSRNQ
ncbi:MAG: nitrous oxide reductase family maturation protein NosD [Isosphaeraceae bacterium]